MNDSPSSSITRTSLGAMADQPRDQATATLHLRLPCESGSNGTGSPRLPCVPNARSIRLPINGCWPQIGVQSPLNTRW